MKHKRLDLRTAGEKIDKRILINEKKLVSADKKQLDLKMQNKSNQDHKKFIKIAKDMIIGGYHHSFIMESIDNITIGFDEPLDDSGNTLLIIATRQGMHKVIEYLITRGSSPNQADYNGNTPLHYAFQYDLSLCIEVLIDNGANETKENALGQRPCESTGVNQIT